MSSSRTLEVAPNSTPTPQRMLAAAGIAAVVALLAVPAHAQQSMHDGLLEKLRDKGVLTQEEYEEIKREREQEQQQMQQKAAAPAAVVAPAPASPPAAAAAASPTAGAETSKQTTTSSVGEALRGIRIKAGGFIELAGIYRSRNETADVGSSYNTGIPFESNPNHELSEFRMSARQSRLSLLAEGNPNENTALAAYFESDFLGAGTTSNSAESNSYTPRLRQAYATYDRSDWGFEVLGGQAWSLVTLNKVGITPRQENIPLTIDAQYTVGFNWTRNAQLRLVERFDNGLSLGFSAESPQANITGAAPTGTTASNPGGSLLNSTATYSTDIAPDLVMKAALDPGWGHYELYGLMRFFRDRVGDENIVTTGGGVGAGTILPIVAEHKLDFQASVLYGAGIGRYGSAQLPDVTFKPDGTLATIPEVDFLVGLVGHPNQDWDYYLYGGAERATSASYVGTKFGYGDNVLVDTKDCFYGGKSANCAAVTANVWQVQLGTWWKFYRGAYGFMELGASYSYIRRNAFSGNAGAPTTDDNIVMTSFRYYPFQ